MRWNQKFFHTAEQVRQLYETEGLNIHEAARQCGVTAMSLHKWMVKFGIPRRRPGGQKGSRNCNWKGGRQYQLGYTRHAAKDHPLASKSGYVGEHTLVMEQSVGRFLTKDERVHHKNGSRSDNRIENLELFPTDAEHQQYERKLTMFSKSLLFGDIAPELRDKLQELLTEYLEDSQ